MDSRTNSVVETGMAGLLDVAGTLPAAGGRLLGAPVWKRFEPLPGEMDEAGASFTLIGG